MIVSSSFVLNVILVILMCVQVSFCFYLVIDLSFSCIKIFAVLLKNITQFLEGFR